MTVNILVTTMVVIAWLFILFPSFIFLNTAWVNRREKLLSRLNDNSIKLYYQQFYPNEKIKKEGQSSEVLDSNFAIHFDRLYGRKYYFIPILTLAIISGIGLFGTLMSVQGWLGAKGVINFPPIAISAFLGAYAWVLGDQLERYQTNDFTFHDVNRAVYRFLIAIPLGISFAAFVKDAVGVPFVFLLGCFPIQTLSKFSRRIVSQKLGLGEAGNEDGMLELQQLQGISLKDAERYQAEGISTIAELAWADPIDLMIKTNKEFSFVIDSISQALLWVYFEKQTNVLYKYSLRGAQEVYTLLGDLDSTDPVTKAAAEKTCETCANLLTMPVDAFKYTLSCVKDDPYTGFLFEIWS